MNVIESQVMIHRTVESSRMEIQQASNTAQMQDFVNKLEKERADQSVNRVAQTEGARQERIDQEKRGRGGETEPGEKQQKNEEREEREILDDVSKLTVGYAPRSRIDIEV